MLSPYLQVPIVVQQAMTTLSAKWYNALVSGSGLSRSEFQLVQGYGAIGTTSESLWRILDQVPPDSFCRRHDPAKARSFLGAYSDLSENAIAGGALRFRKCMGDFFALWENDKANLDPMPISALQWVREFVDWACVSLPNALTQKCINHYKTALLDPTFLAAHLLTAFKFTQRTAAVPAFTLTSRKLTELLDRSEPRSIMFNSMDAPGSLAGAWSQAQEGGTFNLFGGSQGTDHIAPTLKLTNAGVNVRCTFQKLVSAQARPLARPSYDPDLKDCTPWFSPAALQSSYESGLEPSWNPKAMADWEWNFGPNGNLPRACVGLVVADGIKLTLTSKAGLTVDEQVDFSRHASEGIFPFFKRSGAEGWVTDWSFDRAGNAIVSSSCKPGNPQLLGVLVNGISEMLG